MTEPVILTQNLSRSYQTYLKPEGIWSSIKGFWARQYQTRHALRELSISIPKGQIVGLVGSNGAGKTTLLKLLSGLIHPTSGHAEVLGFTPWERKHEYLRQMSILLGQKNQLWWDISPLDSYQLLAKIYDLEPKKARKRVHELASRLRCEHVLEVQLRRLSLGERMKMEIIGALLHEPRILFLDEPTIGLDIVAQSTIREFLSEYARERAPTILLTSHYMDDIALLADRLLLISQGQIVYDGSVEEFTNRSSPAHLLTALISPTPSQEALILEKYPLRVGHAEQVLKLAPHEIGPAVTELSRFGSILSLKIEEADFEDIVRGFLEGEPSH